MLAGAGLDRAGPTLLLFGPLINELLHAIALRLASDDVALRIGREAVNVKELAGLAARAPDRPDQFERAAVQDRDAFVRAVGDVQEPLLRVG
jgi:hypothetical protein